MPPDATPPTDPLLGNSLSGLLDCALDSAVQPVDEPEVPDNWEPPTPGHIAVLLPQYQIEHLIGRGGMGAVYKGRQITLNRPVAIKVLPAELARSTEFVARFHREAQLLASLSHQGIVTIFDFGQTTEGHLYFVMEYVDGTDLYRLIHKSGTKLDAKQALSLTVQICEAMQFAHDNGVVHRDIKPANVLVTRDGRAKLADFGLAMKPADPDAVHQPPKPGAQFDLRHSPNAADMRFTVPGAAMGTPDYAAPEVYEGKADERSDIYALGIMLYEMLTGAPPKGYFQLPSAVTSSVDHRVDQVVVKALEINPAARYQKASDMRLDVEAATKPLPQAPATQPPARTMPRQPGPPPVARRPVAPPPKPKTSKFKVGVWLALVALLGGAGYEAWSYLASEHARRSSQVATPSIPSPSVMKPDVVQTPATAPTPSPTPTPRPAVAKTEPQPAPEPIGVWLGNFTPINARVGWGKLEDKYYDSDRNVARVALLGGKPCDLLLFAHAPSRVEYAIPSGYTRFKATGFGPTPTRLPPSNDISSRKSWKYRVEIDNRLVFESAELIRYYGGEVPIDVRIPPGSKTITLSTDSCGDSNSDHSMWGNPKFYREAFQPSATPAPKAVEPVPNDAISKALDTLERQFRLATEDEAKQILATQIAALNNSYATKGLPTAIAAAWKRNAHEDVAALEKERNRFGTAISIPATDPTGTNGAVWQLHDTYRKALTGYQSEAATHAASARLYEAYLKELNKLAGTASDPNRVRARAKEVAAKGGFRIPFINASPPHWRPRCIDSERIAATLANGGTKDAEEAVSRALFYLKGKQNPDGSWGSSEKAGRTGLTLLAYLGHCETPESSSYGDTTIKAILYLIETSRKNSEGIIAADIGSPHAAAEHAMATTALAEIYEQARLGSRSLPGVRETLEKAVKLIITHQRLDGGWAGMDRGQGFRPIDQGGSAIFTTAWQVHALAAAKRTGLRFANVQEALNRSEGFIRSKQWKDGGFGISRSNPDNDSILLTGAGMNSLQLTRADAATLKKASGFTTDMVLNPSYQWSSADLHGWLFYTQAFITKGGEDWKAWNGKCLPLMLSNQSPNGSWTRSSALFGSNDTDATAVGALILESYYRVSLPRS